ncbi:hypothetical protein TWF281_003089 [Arthrobotrys megalospora]
MPPRNKSVYEVKSKHLGTWIVVIDSIKPPERMDEEFGYQRPNDFILAGSRIVQLYNEFYPAKDEVSWLNPLKATSKRSLAKTPKATLLDNQVSQHFNFDNRKRAGVAKRIATKSKKGPGDNMKGIPIEFRKGIDIDMTLVSQPPDVEDIHHMDWGIHMDTEGGEGVLAYVIDSGFDLSHEEFADSKAARFLGESSENWIYAGPMPDDGKDDTAKPFGDPFILGEQHQPHGTAVASKISAGTIGIAPTAELVVVKLLSGRSSYSEISQIDSLLKIYDHMWGRIKDKSGSEIEGAVIVQGWAWSFGSVEPWREVWRQAILGLITEVLQSLEKTYPNAYFFASSGDGGRDDPIKTQPAAHILDNHKAFENSAVVGGVSAEAAEYIYHEHPEISIYAPADQITIPRGSMSVGDLEPAEYDHASGTAYATSIAAGLCAVFITRGWDKPLKRMKELAWQRMEDGPKVIWSGIRQSDWASDDEDSDDEEDTTSGGAEDGNDNSKKRPAPDEVEDIDDREKQRHRDDGPDDRDMDLSDFFSFPQDDIYHQ